MEMNLWKIYPFSKFRGLMPGKWPLFLNFANSRLPLKKISFSAKMGMVTSSNGNIFRVTGHLCAELWFFFYLHPNKRLSKQWRGWWFDRPSCPLWRHRNGTSMVYTVSCSLWCHAHVIWTTLQWRHNDHNDVSNHQPRGCLLNRLFRRRWKKTSKLRVTGLCAGNSPGPVNSPHKGPVTRKMVPFDDVIMNASNIDVT